MRSLVFFAALVLAAWELDVPAPAAEPRSSAPPAAELGDPDAGRSYALTHCATCHNVTSRSPDAPPWRLGPSFAAIAGERTTTAAGLNAFLQTPHARMPNIIIPQAELRNVIAYILTLKPGYRGDAT